MVGGQYGPYPCPRPSSWLALCVDTTTLAHFLLYKSLSVTDSVDISSHLPDFQIASPFQVPHGNTRPQGPGKYIAATLWMSRSFAADPPAFDGIEMSLF